MEEEIMEIRTVGGQSSSGEKKEYFSALALDLISGLQYIPGSQYQAHRPCYYTDNTVSVSAWFLASLGNLHSALSPAFYFFFSFNPPTQCFFKAGSFPALTQEMYVLRQK